jgi:hypothetical protein
MQALQKKFIQHSNIKVLLLLLIVLLPTTTIWSQPSFEDEVMDTPIDGGLSLLVAAGVGYGAKQLRKQKLKATSKK